MQIVSAFVKVRREVIANVRKNWLLYLLSGIVCGWLIGTGILGLRNNVVTCHTWNIFVLDFSGYDMGPNDTCTAAKSGGNYDGVKWANNAIDWAKVAFGSLVLFATFAPPRTKTEADPSPGT